MTQMKLRIGGITEKKYEPDLKIAPPIRRSLSRATAFYFLCEFAAVREQLPFLG